MRWRQGEAVPRAANRKGQRRMNRSTLSKVLLGTAAAGAAMLFLPSVAFAQEAAGAAERATFLTSNGAAWMGGAIGAGLAIMGGAAGIGRIGGSAVESMGRPPAAGRQISAGVNHNAGKIHGA